MSNESSGAVAASGAMPPARVAVTVAALIERDGQLLCVEEIDDGRLCWNQPAGHLEPGESLLAAVVREVLEETAHAFTPQGWSGIYESVLGGKHYVRVCFVGSVGEPIAGATLDPDIERAFWVTPEALLAAPDRWRSPLVAQCVRDYLQWRDAGRPWLPLDALHHDVSIGVAHGA